MCMPRRQWAKFTQLSLSLSIPYTHTHTPLYTTLFTSRNPFTCSLLTKTGIIELQKVVQIVLRDARGVCTRLINTCLHMKKAPCCGAQYESRHDACWSSGVSEQHATTVHTPGGGGGAER